MDVEFKLDPTQTTPKITVTAAALTDDVKELLLRLEHGRPSAITALKGNQVVLLAPEHILRFFADGKTVSVQTQQDILNDAALLRLCLDSIQFKEAVYNKIANACVHSKGDIFVGLVVAVEEGTLHGEVCLHSSINFTGRDQIDGHTFFGHNFINTLEAGCLAGKEGVTTLTQGFLHGIHIQMAIITDADEKNKSFPEHEKTARTGRFFTKEEGDIVIQYRVELLQTLATICTSSC